MKKWSLIIFTILAQMAVGSFWILTAISLFFRSHDGNNEIMGQALSAFMIVVLIMLVSLLISLTHLGSPTIAYKAILNFRSSWLSREIVFGFFFTLTSAVHVYWLLAKIGSEKARLGMMLLSAICGFFLVYSMTRLYMLRTVPVWNTLYTPISFFLTTLVLGGLLAGFALGAQLDMVMREQVLSIIIVYVLVLLGCELVLSISRVVKFFSDSREERAGFLLLFEKHSRVFYFRLLLLIVGLMSLFIILFQEKFSPELYLFCFMLVLSAEVVDRFLFYAARDFNGI